MNFFKKIKIGLTSPKQISQFRNEKIGKTILYFLFLALIALIPTTIDIAKISSLEPFLKNEIKNYFSDAGGADCVITNYELVCQTTEPTIVILENYQPLVIVFDASNDYSTKSGETAFVFREKGVFIEQGGLSFEALKYADDEGFEGLDFNNSSNRNDNTFWDAFFLRVDNYIANNKMQIAVIGITAAFFTLGLDVLVTLLFMTALLFMLNSVYRIKFSELFRTTTYAMTPYVFVQLVAILLNATILVYVGMILTGIYAITAVRQMTDNFQNPRKEE